MRRREFLKKSIQAASLAAITGGSGWLLHNREIINYQPTLKRQADYRVQLNGDFPAVTLARSADPVVALNRSLDAIGGIKRFISPGERVTIKPNVGWDRTPAQAANTNPFLVGQMVKLCLEAGASEVLVSDVTCNDPRRCFIRSGIREEAEKAGAKVVLARDSDFITVDLGGGILRDWPVLRYFVDTDRLINMPVIKHHSLSECTIGLKNLYGIIGGQRSRLHQKIDLSIVDLATFCRPTLTVVDGTRVLLRGGPQGGSLDDVAIENTVICATDPVAADARSAEFLGLTGDQVGHIAMAGELGLGNIDYKAVGYKEIA